MSLKPVELQVVINQMSEVGKTEKERIKKKSNEQLEKDKKLTKERISHDESIVDVDKVDVGEQVERDSKRFKKKKKHDEESQDGKNKTEPRIKEEYKGNFLDITE
jgi:hypothetical protein